MDDPFWTNQKFAVVGIGIAFLGVAVGIAQWLVPAEKLGAEIKIGLIVLACTLGLVGCGLLVQAFLPPATNPTKRLVAAIRVCGVLVLIGFIAVVNFKTEPQSITPASAVHDPVIEISYELKSFGLPVPIEPFATMPLILIHEDRKVELQNIANNQDARFLWPTTENITPPEWTGQIVLSNHGDMGIFNILYSIKLAIGSQQGPGGVIEVPFTLPLHDLPLGKSQPFTIVNQSSFGAVIHFSKAAVAQIQGQAQRRQVQVQSRDITLFDRVPILMGSWHKWSGSKILEPDQWKKNKKKNHPEKK